MSQTPNMNQKQSLTNKPSRNNNQTYNNTTILTTHYIPPITTHYQATTTPPYQPIHNNLILNPISTIPAETMVITQPAIKILLRAAMQINTNTPPSVSTQSR
jgi:hypothetical protein